jgi:replication initiation and membrane attachment protein
MTWLQVIPNDRYIVGIDRPVSEVEIGYLIHLYQPLLGPFPISLYQTLYYQLKLSNFATVDGLHRGIMVCMAQPLDVILKARYQLEAIGLLDTYRIETDGGDYYFEYRLHPPYSPDVFFQDDTLSIMLLNRVGKQYYRNLRRKYSTRVSIKEENKEKITKAFDEVFYHLSPSEIRIDPGSETEVFLQEVERESPLDTFQEGKVTPRTYAQTAVDFELLEALLPRSIKNEQLFTEEIKQVLQELAFLYKLTDQQLAYFLHEPTIYREDNSIDPYLLRRNVKDWYKHVNQGHAPRIDVIEKEKVQIESGEKNPAKKVLLTREEEKNRWLSSISPFELLSYYHNGAKISPADQKIVEELLEDYQLNFGVVNVLLEYVMLTHDKQLPRSLIYKIASHWKRLNISTVKEAMEVARQLYSEHKGKKEKPTSTVSKKKKPEKRDNVFANDGVPQRIIEKLEQQKNKTISPSQTTEDYEKKKRAVEEMLKALGEKGQ